MYIHEILTLIALSVLCIIIVCQFIPSLHLLGPSFHMIVHCLYDSGPGSESEEVPSESEFMCVLSYYLQTCFSFCTRM